LTHRLYRKYNKARIPGYWYSDTVNVVDIVGEGTSPLHSRGSGGVPPPSSGEIDPIFIVSKYSCVVISVCVHHGVATNFLKILCHTFAVFKTIYSEGIDLYLFWLEMRLTSSSDHPHPNLPPSREKEF
jgi:hypothetical protein